MERVALVTLAISFGVLYLAPDWWLGTVVAVLFVWPVLFAYGCLLCGKFDQYMANDWHDAP